MSASIGGAVKAYLENQGLGISVFRDGPPPGTKKPYVTVIEGLSLKVDGLEDGGPAGGNKSPSTGIELAQVDLWQDKAPETKSALADQILEALHGATLNTPANQPPFRVYGVIVRSRVRLVEELGMATAVVHHAYSLDIHRQI